MNLIVIDGEGDEQTVPFGKAVTYATPAGSPFTLTSSWAKVATTTSATRSLRVGDATQGDYDIFWTVVTADGSAPSGSVLGLPVITGEDFAGGIPIGDVYLRSESGAQATVMTGV